MMIFIKWIEVIFIGPSCIIRIILIILIISVIIKNIISEIMILLVVLMILIVTLMILFVTLILKLIRVIIKIIIFKMILSSFIKLISFVIIFRYRYNFHAIWWNKRAWRICDFIVRIWFRLLIHGSWKGLFYINISRGDIWYKIFFNLILVITKITLISFKSARFLPSYMSMLLITWIKSSE